MLNCVNSLDPHLPLAEQAGLVSEAEKTQQQESSGSERSSHSRDSQDSRYSRERDRDQQDGDVTDATATEGEQPGSHRRGDSSPSDSNQSRCSDRSPIIATDRMLRHDDMSDTNSVIHNLHYQQQYQPVQYPCGVMGGRPPPPLPPPRFPNNAV